MNTKQSNIFLSVSKHQNVCYQIEQNYAFFKHKLPVCQKKVTRSLILGYLKTCLETKNEINLFTKRLITFPGVALYAIVMK